MTPTDRLYKRVTTSNLSCLLCTRTIGIQEQEKGGTTTTRPIRPWDDGAVDRRRCPYCGGNLLLQDGEESLVIRRKLTAEELTPRVGRPRKAVP